MLELWSFCVVWKDVFESREDDREGGREWDWRGERGIVGEYDGGHKGWECGGRGAGGGIENIDEDMGGREMGKWKETERDGKGKREGEGMVRKEKI